MTTFAMLHTRVVSVHIQLRLFHKEFEGHMSADGLWEQPMVLYEDVHLRLRSGKHSTVNRKSSAPTCYWQFLGAEDPYTGGKITWKGLVRIQHLQSACFLTVTPSKAREGDANTKAMVMWAWISCRVATYTWMT